jgi:hypothetical protein
MRRSASLLLAVVLALPAYARDPLGGVVTKAQIIAPRPPNEDRKTALELESLMPIEQSTLVVSVHRNEGHGELTIWAKVPGGYRRLETFVEEPGMGSYAPVTRFNYDARSFLLLTFVPLAARYAPEYTVLAVEADEAGTPALVKVEVQSPIDWFQRKLAPDESVQDGFYLTPKDGRIEWDFALWKPSDSHASPSGGGVHGTFDVCNERWHDDAANRWTSTWRMLVRDGSRQPPQTPAPRTLHGSVLPACPAVAAGALLPQAPPMPGDGR